MRTGSKRLTKQMKSLEAQHGKPIERILMEGFERHGSLSLVAQDLGVAQPTLSQWLPRLRLRIWQTLAIEDDRIAS